LIKIEPLVRFPKRLRSWLLEATRESTPAALNTSIHKRVTEKRKNEEDYGKLLVSEFVSYYIEL